MSGDSFFWAIAVFLVACCVLPMIFMMFGGRGGSQKKGDGR